jgi:general secretion pathway protein J
MLLYTTRSQRINWDLTPINSTPINSRRQIGFTLIEVLVALVVMSLMAVLTWQGIDGMAKASSQHRSRADDVAAIQTGLLQWRTDLDQMIDASQTPPAASGGTANTAKAIEFDARVLRITRRYSGDEIRVVAWGSRRIDTQAGSTRRFMRWVSVPVRTRAEWQTAWDQAARWGQNPSDAERAGETAVLLIDEWQIFYYRNDAWSNPLSADGTATQSSANPDGVRLILQLAPGQIPGGKLSMDWVQPTRGGGKS